MAKYVKLVTPIGLAEGIEFPGRLASRSGTYCEKTVRRERVTKRGQVAGNGLPKMNGTRKQVTEKTGRGIDFPRRLASGSGTY